MRRLALTDADHLLFEAISRHGPLPTNLLYEFTKHVRKDYTHLQNRLTEFYNGDDNGPYLIRPQQQFAGFDARYQHLVYDLAPRAKNALAERGALCRYSPKRTDPFLHQLMGACVGASLELTAPSHGLRYIPRDEILAHRRCPEATRTADSPMAISVGATKLIPDDLFGLEYPGAGFRFFAVEIDRNTESIERKDLAQNSFGRKVAGYFDVLRNQTCRAHWGLPNLYVLTVTTHATHAMNILECVRKQNEPRYGERFALACEPSFGANWRVPRGILRHLLDQSWTTIGAAKDFSRP